MQIFVSVVKVRVRVRKVVVIVRVRVNPTLHYIKLNNFFGSFKK